jgi:hypothetical protein
MCRIPVLPIGRETERIRGISVEGLAPAVLVCEQPDTCPTQPSLHLMTSATCDVVYILKAPIRPVYAGVWLKYVSLLKESN